MVVIGFYFFTFAIIFSIFSNSVYGVDSAKFNVSLNDYWQTAGATWYGSPYGAGSDGGACGYENWVEHAPFYSMIASGGPSLFKNGLGCGACYQVKCTNNGVCSGYPVTVVITDSCPGGPCASDSVHFDMSGTAFGAMAHPGQADQLRNVGVLQVQYRKVNCYYPNTRLTFHVDPSTNPYYFSTLIAYVDAYGEIGSVALKQANSNYWQPMQESVGAVWKLNSGTPLQPPFSIMITSLEPQKTFVAYDVIPYNFQPGQSYYSRVNLI